MGYRKQNVLTRRRTIANFLKKEMDSAIGGEREAAVVKGIVTVVE